jgi:hypothetical protein
VGGYDAQHFSLPVPRDKHGSGTPAMLAWQYSAML